MVDTQKEWTEEDSQLYRQLATVAVPARDEQIATLLTLLPFSQHDPFRVVELGCGEGILSSAILQCFPRATVVALDGSATMRAHTAERLHPFAPRARVAAFDLASTEWFSYLDAADSVVSSLCVHHLSGDEKQRLFHEIACRLSDRGAVIIADLVEPRRPEARAVFAATWDRITEAQATAQTEATRLFAKFMEEKWNYYRFPDPRDRPSGLFDQLTWLKQAGFAVVDCFWLQAGHAIYGGYKGAGDTAAQTVPFAGALDAAHAALQKKH